MKTKWVAFWSEFGVYLAAVIGVLFSRYLPEIMATGDVGSISLTIPKIGELVGAFVVAALVTYILDNKGDKEGKLKAIKRRLFNSFAYGIMWFQLMQTILGGLK